jgi:hypothetical protein
MPEYRGRPWNAGCGDVGPIGVAAAVAGLPTGIGGGAPAPGTGALTAATGGGVATGPPTGAGGTRGCMGAPALPTIGLGATGGAAVGPPAAPGIGGIAAGAAPAAGGGAAGANPGAGIIGRAMDACRLFRICG